MSEELLIGCLEPGDPIDAQRGPVDGIRVPRSPRSGDARASEELFAELYIDLKRLAHARLRACRDGDELSTTAVVHESFLKLAERGAVLPQNRPAFFAYVGKVMRSVVLDAVRERQARKRGGCDVVVPLSTDIARESLDDERLLAIDEALSGLARLAPELSRLVEMRYFVGLSIPEISEITGKAVRTLERDWTKARGLLRRLMAEA
jgi:RNA polymerase sigma factor (TIGR02999 family)